MVGLEWEEQNNFLHYNLINLQVFYLRKEWYMEELFIFFSVDLCAILLAV